MLGMWIPEVAPRAILFCVGLLEKSHPSLQP